MPAADLPPASLPASPDGSGGGSAKHAGLDGAEYLRLRRDLLMRLMKNEITRDHYQLMLQELNELYQLGSKLMGGVKLEQAAAVVAPVKFNPPPAAQGMGPGTKVLDYTVVSRLGRGGMGTVYKAEDARGNPVAIKLFPALVAGNERELARANATFKAVKQLNHANIAQVYRLEEHPEYGLLLVMEFCPGITLDEFQELLRAERGPMTVAEVGRLLKPIADALDYAHQYRVIHRDIKPQNIMLNRDGTGLKLIDFGLAAQIRTSVINVSNATSEVAGTRPYMAPEQWQGHVADAKTDQYALACVAYELLAGHPPFLSGEAAVLERCHRSEPVPAIKTVNALVNAVFWIDDPRPTDLYALAKARASRFASCQAFLAALREREPEENRYPAHWVTYGTSIMCHKHAVSCAAAIGDGRIFATADVGGVVVVWDLGTRQAIRRIRLPAGVPTALCVSSNGRSIFVGTDQGLLLIVDVASGQVLQTRQAHQGAIGSLALGPKQVLATGGADGVVGLFHEDSLENLGQTEPGDCPVTAVGWSPGGLLGWGEASGKVNVASLDSHEPAAAFQAHSKPVTALVFSRENRSVVTAGRDGYVHSFSLAGRHRMHTFVEGGEAVIGLEMLANSDQFVALGADGKCYTFELYKRLQVGLASAINARATAGCYLAGRRMVVLGEAAGMIRLVNMDRASEVISGQTYLYPLTGIELMNRKKVLVTTHSSGEVLFWDLDSRKMIQRRMIGTASIRQVGFLDSDRVCWTWHEDQELIFWDPRTGRKLSQDLPEFFHDTSCLTGERGTNDLLIGTRQGQAILLTWPMMAAPVQGYTEELQYSCFDDVDNPYLVGTDARSEFKLEEARVGGQVQLGDQPLTFLTYQAKMDCGLAVGADGRPAVFRIRAGQLLARPALGDAVGGAFAPDASLVAITQASGKITLFSLNGVELSAIEAHQSAPTACVISADGGWVASGAGDQTVRLSPTRGSAAPIVHAFEHGICGLRFLPNNALLIGLEDGTVVRTTPLF